MKSFKKHIQEAADNAVSYGQQDQNRVATDDLHNFANDSEVLQRLNAFIGSVADREHMTVAGALGQIGRRVEQVGLEFDTELDEDVADTGSSDLPMTQYGGRFGKGIEDEDIDDDFISKDGQSELKLHVEWEKLPNNLFKVVAQIQ